MMKITSMEETDMSVIILHGDGQQRSFDVGYELHRAPIIAVNSYYMDVAQKGTSEADWYWQPGSPIISQHPDGEPLRQEDRLDIIFIGKFKVETITA